MPARGSLWILWAILFACLALDVALARLLPPPAVPWYEAKTAVVTFLLAILSLAAIVGSFALRESLALRRLRSGELDPASAAGFGRVRLMLLVLWGLGHVVGALGVIVAWGSGNPRLVWPYVAAGAGLFLLHAPRRWLFERSAGA